MSLNDDPVRPSHWQHHTNTTTAPMPSTQQTPAPPSPPTPSTRPPPQLPAPPSTPTRRMRRRISRTQSVRNWLWQSGTRTQICKSRSYQLWNILYLLKLSSSSCSVSCSLYCVYLYLIFGPLNFRKTKRFVITLTKKSYSGENKKMEKKGHLFLQLIILY